MEGWYFDIEADSLYLLSKKIWYIRLKSLDGTKTLAIHPFKQSKDETRKQLAQWVSSFTEGAYVVGHNILGYDLWMLWKFFGIPIKVGKKGKDYLGKKPVTFIDTLVLSQYLNPDSQLHSLEFLARGSEAEKMNYRQKLIEKGLMTGNEPKGHEFSFYDPLMDEYCDDDVEAGIGVLMKLWKQATEYYETWVHPSFRQVSKDYFLYSAQAYSGVKFNVEKATKLLEHTEGEMLKIKQEVDPKLPPRELKTAEKAFYKIPAKPFTKNGELSAIMLKWLDKHNATLTDNVIKAYGIEAELIANNVLPVKLPMEIEDSQELKQYFLDSGWIPHDDFWNFKKGADGKNERDEKGKYIKTTPKIQHGGQLCPNLQKLNGEIPSKIVKFLSYRNRKGVVEGWLNNWRIEFDGRLSAEISGYAPTSRVKHRTVCNVPKADIKVLLGNEMRDLFTVDKGFWYCGTDAAALENRTLSHYTFKHDGGKFARMQTEGDPHCYSEDTEILTEYGWKTFGKLSIGEKVAQYEKGVVSFVEPSHIVWQDYEGEMISIKSGKLDFLVTPNHRVLVENYRTRNQKVILAKDVHNRNSNWRVPLNGYIDNRGIDISDAAIKLAVAIQADSYDTGVSYRFEFVKNRKISRLLSILSEIGIEASVIEGITSYKGSKTFRVSINKKLIKDTLLLINGKELNNNVYKLSSKQAIVFVDEVQFWDGTTLDNGDCILDTTSENTRDIVATLASLCGRKAIVSTYLNKKGNFGSCDIYRVYISGKEEVRGAGLLSASVSTIRYKGKIGCVSVPSTFVLVRRNGRIGVSGNTFNAFAFFPELHKKFDINNPDNKDNPEFKPWRNKAKTGAYLLAFGGGAAKLASSLGLSKKDGEKSFDNYWKMNEGLGKLKESAEKYFDTKGRKKFIPAIDGRLVSVRGKNVLLSCLGQGLGAICMSYAACLMDNWLGDMCIDDLGRPYYLYKGHVVKRVSMVHDEYSWEVEDGVQDDIVALSVKAIVKAGEYLNLSLPLDGEGKMSFEGSWRDVH